MDYLLTDNYSIYSTRQMRILIPPVGLTKQRFSQGRLQILYRLCFPHFPPFPPFAMVNGGGDAYPVTRGRARMRRRPHSPCCVITGCLRTETRYDKTVFPLYPSITPGVGGEFPLSGEPSISPLRTGVVASEQAGWALVALQSEWIGTCHDVCDKT